LFLQEQIKDIIISAGAARSITVVEAREQHRRPASPPHQLLPPLKENHTVHAQVSGRGRQLTEYFAAVWTRCNTTVLIGPVCCLSNGLVGLAKLIQFCQRNTELAISLTDMPRFKNSFFCPHTNWRQ
jgi:hypothetical protein